MPRPIQVTPNGRFLQYLIYGTAAYIRFALVTAVLTKPIRRPRPVEDPEGIMEQEEAFVNALLSATTYKIDAGTLELRNESGAIAVTLRRAVGQ